MTPDSDGARRVNSYALVTYIPDPLGAFLDALRCELVPECRPHAHVTLAPPRPLSSSPEEAVEQIRRTLAGTPAFEIEAVSVAVFPVTNVVYLEIGAGIQGLVDLHGRLNRGALYYNEPFPYHPHITLAQEIPLDDVAPVAERARRRWADWRLSRCFRFEAATFVQATADLRWIDLATLPLSLPAVRP